MKKLMVALGAVAMAACAQAASINWKVSIASLTSADSSYLDYNIYLCESIAADGFTSEADIANYLYGTDGNSGTSVKIGTRSPFVYGTKQATAGGISTDDVGMQTVYAVIVSKDGKGYWVSETQGEVYTTATEPALADFDAKELIATAYTPWAGAPGPGPVPEPTSGMLLLLGVAGLALRRRRA